MINHYEKWKVKICGEAGEALMDFISDEFTEPGARGECNLKDYIPEERCQGRRLYRKTDPQGCIVHFIWDLSVCFRGVIVN